MRERQVVLSILPLLALGVAVALSVLLLPPAPGTIDTHAYKDAGVELALGHGLVSSFAFGNPAFEPRVFAGYPPGFALAFGGFAALAGHDALANAWFEQLTLGLVLVLVFLALRPALRAAAGPWPWLLVALLLLAALASRYVLLLRDRPDLVGLAFALGALLCGAGRSWRASGAAALLAGLALLVSPIAGLLAVLGVASRWLLAEGQRRPGLMAMAALGLAGLTLPLGLAAVALQAADPAWLERFGDYLGSSGAEAAAGTVTGTGYFLALLGGDLDRWWDGFWHLGYSTPHHWAQSGLLLVALLGLSLCLRAARETLGRRRTLLLLAGLWLSGLLAATLVPWSKLYSALAAGYLLCLVAAALPARVWLRPATRHALLGTFAAMQLLQAPMALQALVSQASLGASYERMTAALAALPLVDRTGDGEVWVALDPFGYFLFKPLGVGILPTPHPLAGTPAALARIDYAAFSYIGSGDPRRPHRPPWWPTLEPTMELLYRPDLPQLLTLLGHNLSNSSHTWEMELWQRR